MSKFARKRQKHEQLLSPKTGEDRAASNPVHVEVEDIKTGRLLQHEKKHFVEENRTIEALA